MRHIEIAMNKTDKQGAAALCAAQCATRRPAHNWPTRQILIVAALLLAMLVLVACGASSPLSGQAVTLNDFPADRGRGFGEVVIEGVPNDETGLAPGQLAPNFALQLDDGRYITLHDLQGQPVMINFWATWCGPCRLEMPDIVAADAADDELVVLAINVQEDLAAIEPFVTEFGMTMPVGRDVSGDLRTLYQAQGMPTSVFINPDGTVATKWAGLLTEEILTTFLQQIGSSS